MKKLHCKIKKRHGFRFQESMPFRIGVTGFEPATSRPPAVRSNQTEPYPDSRYSIELCRRLQALFFVFFTYDMPVDSNLFIDIDNLQGMSGDEERSYML